MAGTMRNSGSAGLPRASIVCPACNCSVPLRRGDLHSAQPHRDFRLTVSLNIDTVNAYVGRSYGDSRSVDFNFCLRFAAAPGK